MDAKLVKLGARRIETPAGNVFVIMPEQTKTREWTYTIHAGGKVRKVISLCDDINEAKWMLETLADEYRAGKWDSEAR